jgi:hypothetical protein
MQNGSEFLEKTAQNFRNPHMQLCPSLRGVNEGQSMDEFQSEQIGRYIECLRSELGQLEEHVKDGSASTKQLCIASKRVVLAAAELDEIILRCLVAAGKQASTKSI